MKKIGLILLLIIISIGLVACSGEVEDTSTYISSEDFVFLIDDEITDYSDFYSQWIIDDFKKVFEDIYAVMYFVEPSDNPSDDLLDAMSKVRLDEERVRLITLYFKEMQFGGQVDYLKLALFMAKKITLIDDAVIDAEKIGTSLELPAKDLMSESEVSEFIPWLQDFISFTGVTTVEIGEIMYEMNLKNNREDLTETLEEMSVLDREDPKWERLNTKKKEYEDKIAVLLDLGRDLYATMTSGTLQFFFKLQDTIDSISSESGLNSTLVDGFLSAVNSLGSEYIHILNTIKFQGVEILIGLSFVLDIAVGGSGILGEYTSDYNTKANIALSDSHNIVANNFIILAYSFSNVTYSTINNFFKGLEAEKKAEDFDELEEDALDDAALLLLSGNYTESSEEYLEKIALASDYSHKASQRRMEADDYKMAYALNLAKNIAPVIDETDDDSQLYRFGFSSGDVKFASMTDDQKKEAYINDMSTFIVSWERFNDYYENQEEKSEAYYAQQRTEKKDDLYNLFDQIINLGKTMQYASVEDIRALAYTEEEKALILSDLRDFANVEYINFEEAYEGVFEDVGAGSSTLIKRYYNDVQNFVNEIRGTAYNDFDSLKKIYAGLNSLNLGDYNMTEEQAYEFDLLFSQYNSFKRAQEIQDYDDLSVASDDVWALSGSADSAMYSAVAQAAALMFIRMVADGTLDYTGNGYQY